MDPIELDRLLQKLLQPILDQQYLTNRYLAEIVYYLYRPVSLQIQFKGELPNMPGSITDSQTITATIGEKDAAGQPVAFDPTRITWTVATPTIASVTTNPDGSGTFAPVAVGTTQVTVADSGSGLSAQDTLTVTAGAATSLVINFGVPAAVAPPAAS